MLLQILLHPIGAKKNDASILPKAGCCYSVLTNFDFEWNKDKSATLFCPRFYQDCLYVIGNRHQIEIKVWCQFNESSIRVFAKGEKNSKWFFQVDVSSKKQTNEFYLLLLWNLRLTFIGLLFGGNWRHQKNISKLSDL